MNRERAEKNFKFWKNLVNLPRYFPMLPPLKPEEAADLAVINDENLRDIMNSIFSRQLTEVVVEDGCGLSTLYGYILEECRAKSFDRLIIPVSIDLEKTKKEITNQFLERTVKKQVLGNLIENPWDSILAEEFYYYCIAFQEDRDYHVYRADMLDFLFGKRERAWSTHTRTFPFMKKPLDQFLNYLLANMRIQTILFFHIPRHGMDEEKILALVSALKMIYEQNRFQSAAIREAYFINRSRQTDLNREYKRDYHAIKYPRITGAEIFSMMNKRFRPSLPGPMGRKDRIDLGSILDEQFIHLARPEVNGIKDVIEKTTRMMLETLDCDRRDIPYRLAPKPELLEQKDADAPRPEEEPKKKITFKRRQR